MTQDERTVLLVDDDRAIRDTIGQLLEEEGYRVAVAANGLEALEHLREGDGGRPSLIVLDLMMPVMDGWQFREAQLRDPRLASIPVVVLTADGNTRQKGTRMGAAAALQKPIALERLLAVVDACRA